MEVETKLFVFLFCLIYKFFLNKKGNCIDGASLTVLRDFEKYLPSSVIRGCKPLGTEGCSTKHK